MAAPYTIDYYSGQPVVDVIPSISREYDRRTAMLTKISEGRAPLMRLLLNYAKSNGSFVATDTKPMWGIEHERLQRMYFVADSTSTSGSKNDLLYVSNDDGARLQTEDILNLMGFWVKQDSSTGRTPKNATGEDMNLRTPSTGYVLPEQVKILENYGPDSGSASGQCKIRVRRNHGGSMPTGHADMLVDIAGGTWAGNIGDQPFLWKALNSIPEGRDDQLVYSDVDETDYNYCQIVMRKWSATETEQNVNRFFTNEKTFQRNGRRALDEFFKEMDAMATFGTRKTEVVNGRRKWYAGGILEYIPTSNYIGYNDTLFQTANFNTQIKDMFYFGAQTKLVLAGADFYTKFSNMIDNKIILNGSTNGWGLDLVEFRATNGGRLLFAPSDTMSLHGMSDYAIVLDPAHFKYGHLQNMDIKTLTVNQTNPHEMEAEIYGQVTFKRTNPKAHWLFVAN
jgi:hypothetical protein